MPNLATIKNGLKIIYRSSIQKQSWKSINLENSTDFVSIIFQPALDKKLRIQREATVYTFVTGIMS